MRLRLVGPAFLTVLLAGCGGSAPAATSSTGPSPATSPPATASAASSSSAAAPTSPSTEYVADVDIGGRTMHIECVGPTDTGEPTILLEAGFGDSSAAWGKIVSAMQADHRLCAYDRAGMGQSQAATERSRTTSDHVADLRALLDAGGVNGPFVLAGHSYGGMVVTLFSATYPDDVVGLLFVDPRGPRVSAGWREALPPATAGEEPEIAEIRSIVETLDTDPVLNREWLHLAASYEEVNAAIEAPAQLFGDRPVIVLQAERRPLDFERLPPDLAAAIDEAWTAGHQGFADESTAGSVEVVPGVGHYIQDEDPGAVISALERILGEVAGQS